MDDQKKRNHEWPFIVTQKRRACMLAHDMLGDHQEIL